jgi:hypothetical protein
VLAGRAGVSGAVELILIPARSLDLERRASARDGAMAWGKDRPGCRVPAAPVSGSPWIFAFRSATRSASRLGRRRMVLDKDHLVRPQSHAPVWDRATSSEALAGRLAQVSRRIPGRQSRTSRSPAATGHRCCRHPRGTRNSRSFRQRRARPRGPRESARSTRSSRLMLALAQ